MALTDGWNEPQRDGGTEQTAVFTFCSTRHRSNHLLRCTRGGFLSSCSHSVLKVKVNVIKGAICCAASSSGRELKNDNTTHSQCVREGDVVSVQRHNFKCICPAP